MGTTRKTAKKRSESAAQSRSKQKSETSLPKRKSGPHKGPTITWSKVKCFALGLAVAHQWKWRKNGTSVTDWHAVLEVINDIYLQEFEDFRKIYPNSLPNAGKLRSEYSDRDRGRHEKWRLRGDQCTPQEIQAMTRMAHLVVSTEQRLSSVPGSIVRNPAPNDPMWVWYPVNPLKATKTRKSKAKGDSKKRKSKAEDDSESDSEESDEEDRDEDDHDEEDDDEEEQENSEEQADDNDDKEQDDSEEQARDDHNDDEKSSISKNPGGDESSSGSNDPAADDDIIVPGSNSSDAIVEEEDEDDIIILDSRSRLIDREKNEDVLRASDDVEILNAADAFRAARQKSRRAGKGKSRRSRHDARQTQPQRQKTRLHEVHNAHEDHEEPALSTHFQDALDAGRHGNVNRHVHNQSVQLDFDAIEFLKTFENGARRVLKPVADLDLLPPAKKIKPSAFDNAIIQIKVAEAVGNQDGLHITPFNQKELLRRHNQSDVNAVRHDGEMSFKSLAPPEYPAIADIHNHTLDPLLTYFDDDHTENSYSECRRYLITAFQAYHGFCVWDLLNHKRGFSFWDWDIFTDLINPIVTTTGTPRDYVTRVVFHAKTGQPSSSLRFGKLLAMPTKIDGSKGEPNGTLDKILQELNQEPKLPMVHTNNVDFTTQPPTYTIRKRTYGPGHRFIGNNFRSIPSSQSLYEQTGEVRRVLLEDESTGQGKEVDLMLCDKPLCPSCQHYEPSEEQLMSSFENSEQRKQLPLVHHKDIVMFGDGDLYFIPMEQDPVTHGAIVNKQDIHDVFFNGGKASSVIFCDKAICGACKNKKVIADLVYRGPR